MGCELSLDFSFDDADTRPTGAWTTRPGLRAEEVPGHCIPPCKARASTTGSQPPTDFTDHTHRQPGTFATVQTPRRGGHINTKARTRHRSRRRKRRMNDNILLAAVWLAGGASGAAGLMSLVSRR